MQTEALQKARNMDLLSDEHLVLALRMIDDRNKSTRLRKETMTTEAYNRAREYATFMERVRSDMGL